MRTLLKYGLMVAMCWMVLALVDGQPAQARHGYHAARHAYRHAYRGVYRPVHVHAAARHAYYPGVRVVAPRVRVHVGPTVGVVAYPAVPVYAAPVYGGCYYGW
jgi:hypothetical protein